MAVVVAFRVAIALTPAAVRVVKWAEGPGVDQAVRLGNALWERLADPTEDDGALSASVSEQSGRVATVATFTETFELRKAQVLFARIGGGATPEDKAVITFHFLKLVGGNPSSEWVAGDFTTIESALTTFWNAIKTQWHANTILDEIRWYRTGPQRDVELGGVGRTGPPVRVFDYNLPGTSSGFSPMPPQVAISVTEQTADKTAWGRFYLPNPTGVILTADSARIHPTPQATIANAADAFYEACRTANTPVVVYSAAKPERPKKPTGTLPARVARALTVDQVQVDDLFDVIRSRRWSAPLLRLQRAIG